MSKYQKTTVKIRATGASPNEEQPASFSEFDGEAFSLVFF